MWPCNKHSVILWTKFLVIFPHLNMVSSDRYPYVGLGVNDGQRTVYDYSGRRHPAGTPLSGPMQYGSNYARREYEGPYQNSRKLQWAEGPPLQDENGNVIWPHSEQANMAATRQTIRGGPPSYLRLYPTPLDRPWTVSPAFQRDPTIGDPGRINAAFANPPPLEMHSEEEVLKHEQFEMYHKGDYYMDWKWDGGGIAGS